ncbi:unnamed protein product, partial [Adineta steineri]
MNQPSSNIPSAVYTNQTHAVVSSDNMNNHSYVPFVSYHQNSFNTSRNNFPPRPYPQQFYRSINYNSQPQYFPLAPNQRPPFNFAPVSTRFTSRTYQTTDVQNIHHNQQYRYQEQQWIPKNNFNQTNKTSVPQGQTQMKKVAIPSREFTPEHLYALNTSFDKILNDHCFSKTDLEQHLDIYHHLRDIIHTKQPDAQITLYGSLLFECCLKETSDIDIDIQFNKTLPYETLKELLDIVRTSNHCKEAYINTDHDQLCIDMSIINSNILVRITSNNIRAIQLSQIIEIYTKFDKRLLSLLRLFRILAKTCNLDRPDLGTLHPIVFHFMIIHFLQQLDPPILPCLHEC